MGPKKGFTAAFDTEIKARTFRLSEIKGEKAFGRLKIKFTILTFKSREPEKLLKSYFDLLNIIGNLPVRGIA
jgi:hypothetical protein